jgi:cyclophilin family peptidyl-prolyl cis-trans isomerase
MKKHKSILWGALLLSLLVGGSFKPKDQPRSEFVEINTRYGSIIIGLYNETPEHRDNFLRLVERKEFDSLLFHCVTPGMTIQGGDPKSKYAKQGDLLGVTDQDGSIPMEIVKGYYHKRGALAMCRDKRFPLESSSHQFYIVQGRTFSAQELVDIENHNNLNGKRDLLGRVMQSDSVQAKIEDFKLRGDKDGLHNYMLSLQDGLDKLYEPLMFKFSAEQTRMYMQNGGTPHLDGLYTVFGEVVYGMNVVDSIANERHAANGRPWNDVRMTAKIIHYKGSGVKR